jgi:hypothetical protein
MAYDRILAVGEVTWQDFEILVPVTVHDFNPDAYAPISVAPGLGVVMRWQGHTPRPTSCPPPMATCYWIPQGETAWYDFGSEDQTTPPAMVLGKVKVDGRLVPNKVDFTLQDEVTYLWRVRVESLDGGISRYSFRWWKQSGTEPATWLLTYEEEAPTDDNLDFGSLLLVAHHVDVSFGDVQVIRLGGVTGTPTATATSTVTPAATATATASPSATSTTTPTATGTATPTATGTATPTATGTATPTATSTITPTATGTTAPTPAQTPPATATPPPEGLLFLPLLRG